MTLVSSKFEFQGLRFGSLMLLTNPHLLYFSLFFGFSIWLERQPWLKKKNISRKWFLKSFQNTPFTVPISYHAILILSINTGSFLPSIHFFFIITSQFNSSVAYSIQPLNWSNNTLSVTMKFSATAVILTVAAAVQAQSLFPDCASSCTHILDKAGCGQLTTANIACFCENKDKVYNQIQSCLISSGKCSLNELLGIRSKVNSYCG